MPDNGNTLAYKEDFERAQEYWEAFWQGQIIDRPVTVLCADRTDKPVEPARLQPVAGDFEAAVAEFDAYLDTHAFLGECMPAFRPGFGPDQMAGFLGAPIVISPDSQETSWSEKIVDDWSSFLPLEIADDSVCWQRMLEFHGVAEEQFRGRCLLREIDLHSNLDNLEGLRGAQKLLYDIIDTPDIVRTALLQAQEVYRQVSDELFNFGNKRDLGTTSELPMYSRGRFNRIQADFICLLNPELFRGFALEAIRDEAQYLDHSCFHLDGPDALTHLDDLLAVPEIGAFQWVPGAGSKRQAEWPEVLHRMQDAGKAIILHVTAEELKAVHGEYRPELLVYEVKTRSVAEGLELLDWLKTHT